MTRLRRAWAVLRGREVLPASTIVRSAVTGEIIGVGSLPPGNWEPVSPADAERIARAEDALITSLRASLEDATRTIARLSGEKAGLESAMRDAHRRLDDGLANPTENHR